MPKPVGIAQLCYGLTLVQRTAREAAEMLAMSDVCRQQAAASRSSVQVSPRLAGMIGANGGVTKRALAEAQAAARATDPAIVLTERANQLEQQALANLNQLFNYTGGIQALIRGATEDGPEEEPGLKISE